MSKRNLSIAIGMVAAFAFVFASVTYAAAVKIKSLVPEVGENEAADGMVILNYSQGSDKTETQVAITDFTPGETYRVLVISTNLTGGQLVTVDGEITTNASGNGQFHSSDPGDATDSFEPLEIIVYIDNDPPNDAFEFPGIEDPVRATGIEN